MMRRMLAYFVLLLGLGGLQVLGFDNSRNDNVALYWGQDSSGNQKTLSFYCQDDTVDAIPLAFLYVFFGPGGEPQIDLSNICGQFEGNYFPGTQLSNCSFLASDIQTCQNKGKIVTLSLGGATGKVGFSSDNQARAFADQVWNLFLGGGSTMRPFGSAVLDGIDLDIEGGTPAHYATFVNRIRAHAKGAKKRYYVTAAPQCPFPDQAIGAALSAAPFDAVYVQFYNNYCGLNHPDQYNFATWDTWAKTQSPNPNVKVYIGAPGSNASAGDGYVDPLTLQKFALDAQQKYSSFGGVMMWDASSAFENNRYDRAVKQAMNTSPHSGSPHPSPPPPSPMPPILQCQDVQNWQRRSLYTAGTTVVSNGHLWTAQSWTQNALPRGGSRAWHDNGTCTPPAALHTQPQSRSESKVQVAEEDNVATTNAKVKKAVGSDSKTLVSAHPRKGGIKRARTLMSESFLQARRRRRSLYSGKANFWT